MITCVMYEYTYPDSIVIMCVIYDYTCPNYTMMTIEYWLWSSKGNKNDINTWSTIVLILSESHQDLGATETYYLCPDST